MTTKKSRKPLDDALGIEFVYGKPAATIPLSEPAEESEPLTNLDPVATPKSKAPSVPKTKKNVQPDVQPRLMTQLIQAVPQKEATVRLTVDLTETQHRKLSILCAKTGRKKAEIVRMLLSEALDGIED